MHLVSFKVWNFLISYKNHFREKVASKEGVAYQKPNENNIPLHHVNINCKRILRQPFREEASPVVDLLHVKAKASFLRGKGNVAHYDDFRFGLRLAEHDHSTALMQNYLPLIVKPHLRFLKIKKRRRSFMKNLPARDLGQQIQEDRYHHSYLKSYHRRPISKPPRQYQKRWESAKMSLPLSWFLILMF